MCDRGVLPEDAPVELLGGAFVVREPQDPPHAAACEEIAERLAPFAREHGGSVRSDKPLHAGPHDLPEPDVAVVRGAPRDYRNRHPSGADTLLVVEVAWTSQHLDRRKARAYARSGVPTYWIVDLVGRRLTVHEAPNPERARYERIRTLYPDDSVVLPDSETTLTVADLLG